MPLFFHRYLNQNLFLGWGHRHAKREPGHDLEVAVVKVINKPNFITFPFLRQCGLIVTCGNSGHKLLEAFRATVKDPEIILERQMAK